jgi:hypothetical protein
VARGTVSVVVGHDLERAQVLEDPLRSHRLLQLLAVLVDDPRAGPLGLMAGRLGGRGRPDQCDSDTENSRGGDNRTASRCTRWDLLV